MKRLARWALVMMIFVFTLGNAQVFQNPFVEPEKNQVFGGIGITWIDSNPYTTFTLAPDLSFGKLGVGLYLQFLMDNNNNFKFRKDEYQGGAGVLRAIRYVRYGRKYDPIYVRVGMLELASLGNGFLMWNYNNSSNYDKRKIGLAADLDFGKFGFESITSNLNHLELIGGNFYLRPFRYFLPEAPLLKNFRLYATYLYDRKVRSLSSADSSADLKALGFGADLQWLNLGVLKSFLYADYGKFIDFGSGEAVGISAIIPNFIGVFGLAAKFEKRFIGEQFIPNFFGPLYELNRNLDPLAQIASAPKTEGYFGELAGHIIHQILIVGNYQRLNGITGSGVLHLEASAPKLVPNFELRAYYDKSGIETFEDARTLDSRSIATAEVGYRLNRFLVIGTVYRWYWVETVNEFGFTEYKPVERVEPRIAFSYQF